MSYNRVILQGFISSDIELKKTPRGKDCARFRIAVNRVFNKKKDVERQADFFNCAAFGWRGTCISKYFWRGKAIMISGQLLNNVFTNDKGEKVIFDYIRVDEFSFADSARDQINDESGAFGIGMNTTDEDARAIFSETPPPPPPPPELPDEPPPFKYTPNLDDAYIPF